MSGNDMTMMMIMLRLMCISIIRRKCDLRCGFGNVSLVTPCVTSVSGEDDDQDHHGDICYFRNPRVKECPTCRQKITGRNMLAEKLAMSLYGN